MKRPSTTANVAALGCKAYDASDPSDVDADEECRVGIVATVEGVSGQARLTILKPVAIATVLPSGTTALSLSAKPSQLYTAVLRAADGSPIRRRGRGSLSRIHLARICRCSYSASSYLCYG